MKTFSLADITPYFFILLFLYTGLVKLTEIQILKDHLISSPLIGSMAGLISWALPVGELLLAIALFVPRWRLTGLYLTLALMALFTVYVIVALFIDHQISCSCGGIVEQLSPQQHILFNSTCIILSLFEIIIQRKPESSIRLKWIMNSSVFCLLLLIGWTLFSAFTAPLMVRTGFEGRPLPAFELQLSDSVSHLNTADIPTGRPLIVIGFSPTCIHCQAETIDILNHIDQFRNTRICFITSYPFEEMKVYYKHYKLKNYPNILMGRDSADAFLTYFKAKEVPFTTIYDPKKRLKQVMIGQTNSAALSRSIAD